MRNRSVTMFLACLALLACNREATVPLEQMASPAPDIAAPQEAPVVAAGALATVVLRQPQRLVAHARPLLGLADDVKAAAAVADELDRLSGLYGELTELALLFDEEAGRPQLAALKAFVVLRPAAGSKAADLLAVWQPRMALLPGWPGVEGVACAVDSGLVVCGPQGQARPDGLLDRARTELEGSTARVLLTLDVPGFIRVAEEMLSVPLLWAVMPEAARSFTQLRLDLSEDPDRLAIELVTHDSSLEASLVSVFEPIERPLSLPVDLPVVAFSSVKDLATRLENLQNFWDNKVPIPRQQRVQALLNDSWQSQMLELANGLVGVALVGDVPISELDPADPLDTPGLIYFIQVTEQDAMEARLKHVFNTKYFVLADRQLEGDLKITSAFWKKGRKGKDKRERLSWYYDADSHTYYFGLFELLEALVEQRNAAAQAGRTEVLALAPGEAARIRFAPGAFVNRLTASSKGGIGAAMALGMVKNSVGAMEKDLVVRLLNEERGGGIVVAEVEIAGPVAALQEAVKKADSLLQMLPQAK